MHLSCARFKAVRFFCVKWPYKLLPDEPFLFVYWLFPFVKAPFLGTSCLFWAGIANIHPNELPSVIVSSAACPASVHEVWDQERGCTAAPHCSFPELLHRASWLLWLSPTESFTLQLLGTYREEICECATLKIQLKWLKIGVIINISCSWLVPTALGI